MASFIKKKKVGGESRKTGDLKFGGVSMGLERGPAQAEIDLLAKKEEGIRPTYALINISFRGGR